MFQARSLFALSLGAALTLGSGCQVGDADVGDSNLAAQGGQGAPGGPSDQDGQGGRGHPGGHPGRPEQPPPDQPPPPDACQDLQAAAAQCRQDLDPVCLPQADALRACHEQVEPTCAPARLGLEQCLATAPDPSACRPLEEALHACFEQALGACEALAAGVDACYGPCHPLEARLQELCAPPPPEPFCLDLRLAIADCYDDLGAACQPELGALAACQEQAGLACEGARQALEQCLQGGGDPAACFPLEEAFRTCVEQSPNPCEPLAAAADACLAPCQALERQFQATCEPPPPPPPPAEDMCGHLLTALQLCLQEGRPDCGLIEQAVIGLCGAPEHPCPGGPGGR
jgi:hypothetical protein